MFVLCLPIAISAVARWLESSIFVTCFTSTCKKLKHIECTSEACWPRTVQRDFPFRTEAQAQLQKNKQCQHSLCFLNVLPSSIIGIYVLTFSATSHIKLKRGLLEGKWPNYAIVFFAEHSVNATYMHTCSPLDICSNPTPMRHCFFSPLQQVLVEWFEL